MNNIRINELTIRRRHQYKVADADNNVREWLLAVFTEHAHYRVQHDLGLVKVSGSALDEHIARVECDLAVIAYMHK